MHVFRPCDVSPEVTLELGAFPGIPVALTVAEAMEFQKRVGSKFIWSL